jgi:hypothetical protein
MAMKRALAGAVGLLALGVSAGLGAAGEAPELELKNVTVRAYERLVVEAGNRHDTGCVETLTLPGKVFLSVSVEVAIHWPEDVRRLRVDPRQIVLVGDDGNTLAMIGNLKECQFLPEPGALYAFRPARPEEAEFRRTRYTAVFAVPAAARTFQFRLASVSQKVTVPAKTVPFPDPAEWVEVKITGARLLEEVRDRFKQGGLKAPTAVRNPRGKVLEVTFRLTPKKENGSYSDQFVWNTSWIGVVHHGAHYTPAIGEQAFESIRRAVNHNYNFDFPRADEATFYFAVPNDTSAFSLTFLNSPVADGKVGAEEGGDSASSSPDAPAAAAEAP